MCSEQTKVDKTNKGYNAQNYVKEYFESHGFDVVVVDDFFDLIVTKNSKSKKIEVKSCHLLVNRSSKGGVNSLGWGRFNFTNPTNTKLQKKHNVDVCFVCCINGCFEIIGILNAKTLNVTGKYYDLYLLFSRTLPRINAYMKRFNKSKDL